MIAPTPIILCIATLKLSCIFAKNKGTRMFTLNCNGKLLVFDRPLVMGIINATPDSFYGPSRKTSLDAVVDQAGKMLEEGATILDIGGQSTRPGSEQLEASVEAERVIPAIEAIRKHFDQAFISVDTYYAKVAAAAVEAGAHIVNDISGGMLDNEMIETVGSLKVPFVCTHMQGNQTNMQQNPFYNNVTKEVIDFFIERVDICKKAGINDVIIDPGFGFGKTADHNFTLLKNLPVFKIFEKPILVGISRKGMIYKTLGISASEALNGTTVLNTIGVLNGASIIRVHDVKEAVETIKLVQQTQMAQQ
jgi:dihydropteroate synthase